MSFIEGVAREALVGAHRDLGKARRGYLLVAGVLALVHLLTVHPYISISTEAGRLEASIATKSKALAGLEPELERLQTAQRQTWERLDQALRRATDDMIADFADLGRNVAAARDGRVSPDGVVRSAAPRPNVGQTLAPPLQEGTQVLPPQGQAPDPFQQMPLSDQFEQMAIPEQFAMPQQQMQQQMQAQGLPPPLNEDDVGTTYIDPDLAEILLALQNPSRDSHERISTYARRTIVEPAYDRAQQNWDRTIRPAYIEALGSAAVAARQAAASLPDSSEALMAAATALKQEEAAVSAIVISPDQGIDESFESDWWATVGGKLAFASAVVSAVGAQLQGSSLLGQPFAAVEEALAQQEAVRSALLEQRDALEAQFADQRKQLAALAGTSAFVPVDLRSFIGLFPLVLGLALGLTLLRIGQARREAALALRDLTLAAPEGGRETRIWLTRRALDGQAEGLAPSLTSAAMAAVALAWIVWSAVSLQDSPLDPPLPAVWSATIGIAMVVGACAWDVAAIRRLVATLEEK
ncbi:hypothetical protein [Pelagibius sp.]|uniref:hypothetical protein n=1 Tax=Pelagibius sp. TaxID=1931238 RepID=UPI002603AB1C|nr:hypothetical protein [Pelagibius sp.]